MHLPTLDGVRGFAAYLVFLSHYSLISGIAGGSFGHGGGQIGVMLFFVLSGFLMAHLYRDRAPTVGSIVEFLRRRAARVLPLFYSMVTLALLAGYLFPGLRTGYPVNAANVVDHYFLIRGVGPFWTIPVEIHYYLIFCLIWIIGYYFRIYLIIIVSLLIAIISLYPNLLSSISSMRIFTSALLFFLIGSLISYLDFRPPPRLADFLFLACFLSLPFLFPRLVSNLFNLPPPKLDGKFIYAMWSSIEYLVFSAVVLWSSLSSRVSNYVFGSAVARFFGKISYSLYLWQAPVLFITAEFINLRSHPMVGFLIANIVVIGISYLSFRVIEDPSRRALT